MKMLEVSGTSPPAHHIWCPVFPETFLLWFLPGCSVSPPAPPPPLLLPHPRPVSLPPLPHVDWPPEGRLVLAALDALHLHGDAPRPWCRATRIVDVSVWPNSSDPLLAVHQYYSHTSSPVLSAHVPDRNQGCDLHQTWSGHRRLDKPPPTPTPAHPPVGTFSAVGANCR